MTGSEFSRLGETTVECRRCKVFKSADQFARSSATKRGCQSYCRQCKQQYDLEKIAKLSDDELQIRRTKYNAAALKAYHNNKKLIGHVNRKKPPPSDLLRVSRNLIYSARQRSTKYVEIIDLTIDWVKSKIEGGFCERTGIAFELGKSASGAKINPFGPSLDRIDGRKGYTEANCQIVCTIYNVGKNCNTDEEFIRFCHIVAQTNPLDKIDT